MYVIRFLLIYLSIASPLVAMEQQPILVVEDDARRNSLDAQWPVSSVFGGGALSMQALNVIPLHDELADLRSLMGAVMHGIVVRDHKVLLPGRVITLPLPKASQLIIAAMNQADELQSRGEDIVQSPVPSIRECQKMQKLLWDFLMSTDLLATGTDNQEYKEMLHINRMLRFGALATQNETILKTCGRAPVFQQMPGHNQVQDLSAPFPATSVLMRVVSRPTSKKSGKCFSFFARRTHKK